MTEERIKELANTAVELDEDIRIIRGEGDHKKLKRLLVEKAKVDSELRKTIADHIDGIIGYLYHVRPVLYRGPR